MGTEAPDYWIHLRDLVLCRVLLLLSDVGSTKSRSYLACGRNKYVSRSYLSILEHGP
jgi:hypothetical protein